MVTEENRLSFKNRKHQKVTGVDNVPPYIYKGCIDIFVKPLVHIFNLSIKTSTYPSLLKNSVISPIPKAGKTQNNIEHYRPITILNSLAKIYETILCKQLLKYFYSSFSDQQHGFLPDRSTVTNLCLLTCRASEAINNKKQLDVIMTDCTKAFDKVDHGLLIKKLSKFNFSRSAYMLIKSYLDSRKLQVKVGKCLSSDFHVTSGVPQGSNLGPLLFVFFC